MSTALLVWLFPIAFLFNDGEELITMGRWMQRHRDGAAGAIESRMVNWEKPLTPQIAVAISFVGLCAATATYIGLRSLQAGSMLHPVFVGAVAVMFFDGVKHVALSLGMREYSSGAVTAALVEIPYTAYALNRFLSLHLTSWKSILLGGVIGAPLALAAVCVGFALGRALNTSGRTGPPR